MGIQRTIGEEQALPNATGSASVMPETVNCWFYTSNNPQRHHRHQRIQSACLGSFWKSAADPRIMQFAGRFSL